MRNTVFENDGIYHIFNRGVEKRDVYLDTQDYLKFVHDLYEFNDTEPAVSIYYEAKPPKPRKLLVEILAFCLLPNHFHLLLRQKQDGGIRKFMHKLGTGYTMSFNQRYERVGSLFQGPFKAVLVEKDSHFVYLPFYVHLNPLDLKFPKWRDKEIKNYKEAMKFLENYRWSSFPDYIGKKNFSSVTQREFLIDFFGGPEQHKKDMIDWLKNLDLEALDDLILEAKPPKLN